nr:hypothetical protein [uncultured Flavobacterium sp.]
MGEEAYNMSLSLDRANEVKNIIEKALSKKHYQMPAEMMSLLKYMVLEKIKMSHLLKINFLKNVFTTVP